MIDWVKKLFAGLLGGDVVELIGGAGETLANPLLRPGHANQTFGLRERLLLRSVSVALGEKPIAGRAEQQGGRQPKRSEPTCVLADLRVEDVRWVHVILSRWAS